MSWTNFAILSLISFCKSMARSFQVPPYWRSERASAVNWRHCRARQAWRLELTSQLRPIIRTNRGIWPITDGINLPFADNSFDVIYSSNTMEHVLDECGLHNEFKRVLRPAGVAVHVVPSSTWRLWTMATHYLILPRLILAFVRRRTEPHGAADAPAVPTRKKARNS
jgi:SAM-dependent methyltransferase